jgi:MFS family permease
MKGRFQNRWWVVFASVLGLLVGNGPIMQFTFGVLLTPVSREFGWNRGTVSSAIVAGLWTTAVATPVFGRLVDRLSIRVVALPAIILFSLSTASVALVPASPAAFTALYAVMGLAAAGQTPIIYAKAISARFDDKRGLALGIAMAGVGLGAAAVPQFAQALIGLRGWREAYIGLGVLTFVLAFPAVALIIGRQPMPLIDKPSGRNLSTMRLPGLTGREALRTHRFWVLAVSFFIVAGACNGTIAHLVPFLTDRGVPPGIATSVLATAGIALIGGRLLAGYLLDRIFAPYVAMAFFFGPLIGIVLLLMASQPAMAAAGTVLVGVGLGAEVDLIAFLLSRYLGMRSFGEIYGYLFAIFMLGSGLGPFAMGVSFDRRGSYNLILECFGFALVAASILILRLGPYAYPVSHRDGTNAALRAAVKTSSPTATDQNVETAFD